MTKDRKPAKGRAFDWVALAIASAAILVFTFADWKQAGTQYAQSSVVRSVR
jgi:hypothetical protein